METKRSALDPHELRDLGARIDHYESTVPIWVSENFIFDQTADVGTESAVATAEAGAAGATTVKQIKMEEKDAAGQVEKVPIEGVKVIFRARLDQLGYRTFKLNTNTASSPPGSVFAEESPLREGMQRACRTSRENGSCKG